MQALASYASTSGLRKHLHGEEGTCLAEVHTHKWSKSGNSLKLCKDFLLASTTSSQYGLLMMWHLPGSVLGSPPSQTLNGDSKGCLCLMIIGIPCARISKTHKVQYLCFAFQLPSYGVLQCSLVTKK